MGNISLCQGFCIHMRAIRWRQTRQISISIFRRLGHKRGYRWSDNGTLWVVMEDLTFFPRRAGMVCIACVWSPARLLIILSFVHPVYGRENRLKVSRDEAKFEEENKLKRERHVQVMCCPIWSSPTLLCLYKYFKLLLLGSRPFLLPGRLREKLGGVHCCRGQGNGRQVCSECLLYVLLHNSYIVSLVSCDCSSL